MDRRRMQTRRPRHASPVVMLELDDLELIEETARRAPQRRAKPRARRYPPAMSDRELRRLVDECTEELCSLGYRGYRFR